MKMAETGEDGSYRTAEIPYGAPFAMVEAGNSRIVWLSIGAAVILVGANIAVVFAVLRKKRKK